MKTLAIALSLSLATIAAADPLPKQLEGMQCLLGNWKGTATASMGKDKVKVDITWSCKPTSAKFGVLCSAHMTGIPGVAVYDETDLFGYEPGSDTYHWFAVTNGGETHDHVAKNPGESPKLQFVFSGMQEGKPFKEVIDMEVAKDEKSLSLRSESFVAGASTFVLDGKVHK
jgi:hypothetical protein